MKTSFCPTKIPQIIDLKAYLCFVYVLWFGSMVDSSNESQTGAESLALIPYNPPLIGLEIFQVSHRNFTFAGKSIEIQQSWNNFGVAAVVWEAAVVLGRYLETLGQGLKGKKVIELGAGTGLAGLVAAQLGAFVTLTDRKLALNVTKTNMEKNFEDLFKQGVIKAVELEWGQNVSSFAPPFDFVIGADVVYIEETFRDLLKTLDELSNRETVVLLSCKIRYERDKHFLHLLKKKFSCEKVVYDPQSDIYVYKAQKRDVKY